MRNAHQIFMTNTHTQARIVFQQQWLRQKLMPKQSKSEMKTKQSDEKKNMKNAQANKVLF